MLLAFAIKNIYWRTVYSGDPLFSLLEMIFIKIKILNGKLLKSNQLHPEMVYNGAWEVKSINGR
ncbi:hypothetical protein CU633_12440 [Bacillus sp. V3-13]|nr:hypothetical protein CU633_12440 [Bacillus sp. V3-13]